MKETSRLYDYAVFFFFFFELLAELKLDPGFRVIGEQLSQIVSQY